MRRCFYTIPEYEAWKEKPQRGHGVDHQGTSPHTHIHTHTNTMGTITMRDIMPLTCESIPSCCLWVFPPHYYKGLGTSTAQEGQGDFLGPRHAPHQLRLEGESCTSRAQYHVIVHPHMPVHPNPNSGSLTPLGPCSSSAPLLNG